jgi:hypothetical protein
VRPTAQAKRRAIAGIQVTRQLTVDEVITLTELPEYWTVSRPDHRVAYILDLTNDPREWSLRDKDGNLKSIASIIKSQDQDAWGGGTAGSAKGGTIVKILGNRECQRSKQYCQGVYHCSEIDVGLLCQRYEPNEEDRRRVVEAQHNVRQKEGYSNETTVLA